MVAPQMVSMTMVGQMDHVTSCCSYTDTRRHAKEHSPLLTLAIKAQCDQLKLGLNLNITTMSLLNAEPYKISVHM